MRKGEEMGNRVWKDSKHRLLATKGGALAAPLGFDIVSILDVGQVTIIAATDSRWRRLISLVFPVVSFMI
jgi:hypothetical protein